MHASDGPGGCEAALGGPLETLFRACPAHDLVALAEPEAGFLEAECLPELSEPGVDALDLGLSGMVEPVCKTVPELLPLLRESFDLGMDLCDGHVV
jgi:hypothetical protein